MRKSALPLIFAILTTPIFVLGHIPSTPFIFERTTDNNGRGAYRITQDIHLISSEGTIRLREEWEIRDGNGLRLKVRGLDEKSQGTQLERLYVGSVRHTRQDGSLKNEQLNLPMAESFFHARNANHLMRLAVSIGVLPAEAQTTSPPPKDLEQIQLKSNPYARLARTGGSVGYAFGRPSRNPSSPSSGIWIEQDQFKLQRVRFPDGAEVLAKDYSGYSRNLHFPKQRSFVWENSRAEARLVNVTPLQLADVNLQPASLKNDDQLPYDSGTASRILSFYSRFR